MRKILTMALGLLTVIALFAVVAAARNGDADADADTRTATAVASGEEATEGDRDGADRNRLDQDDAAQGGEDRERLDQDGADRDDGEDPDDLDRDQARKAVAVWNTDRDYEEVSSRKFRMLAAMGIINQDQIPALTAWITEADTDFDDPAQLLAALVADEVITQKQADAITDFFFPYQGMKPDQDGYRHTQPSDADDSDHDDREGDDDPADHDGKDRNRLDQDGEDQDDGEDPDDLDRDQARKAAAAWNTDDAYAEVTARKFRMLAAMGIINDDQIPALTAWITEADTDFDDPAELLAALVADEVITQKQADSITDFFVPYQGMKPDKDGYRHTQPSDADDSDDDGDDPADDGEDQDDGEDPDDLDRDEARKAAAAWNTDDAYEEVVSRKFRMLAAMGIINDDQIPALTAWITEADTDFDDPAQLLAALVADEVITQEQADSITDFFFPYQGMKPDKDGYRHTEPSDADDSDDADREEDPDEQDGEAGHRQTESSGDDDAEDGEET